MLRRGGSNGAAGKPVLRVRVGLRRLTGGNGVISPEVMQARCEPGCREAGGCLNAAARCVGAVLSQLGPPTHVLLSRLTASVQEFRELLLGSTLPDTLHQYDPRLRTPRGDVLQSVDGGCLVRGAGGRGARAGGRPAEQRAADAMLVLGWAWAVVEVP